MEEGYIHVYTGNGKGKTTAAFGLAVRALCAGKKVFVGQFVKDMKYNETKLKDCFEYLEVKQFGKGCFIQNKPEEQDIQAAKEGLEECKSILQKGEYNLVILDELNIALYFKLLKVEDVLEAIKSKASHVEVVITGRYAPDELILIADLVTEMKEIKHYYNKGVEAREGIER